MEKTQAMFSHPRHHPTLGILILTLATFIWGTTFVVTKQALQNFPASSLVFARFLIAAIAFVPFLRPGKRLWTAATELGLWLWLGFATQTIGLRYTTVNRSAFITSMHVILVPALTALLGRIARPIIWIAAALALLGVALLSHDGSPPNIGDLWSAACALSFAIYITRLETFTSKLPTAPLTAAHLWIVVILSAAWTFTPSPSHPLTPSSPIPWPAILYLGIAATAVTTWLQTLGQKWVTAPRAAVLYTLEPVWAAFFGWIILHEKLGLTGWLGAILILTAAVLTQIPRKSTAELAEVPAISNIGSGY
jgi:drug/metabolite transporter (DMT)-like permease